MSNKQDLEQNVVSDKPISNEPKDNNKNTSSIDSGHQGESDKTVKRSFVKRLINKVIEYKKLTTFESLSLLLTLCGLISIIFLMLQLKTASNALEKTAIYNISTREFEVNKLLFEHPELQPYFFSGKDINEDDAHYGAAAVVAGLRVDFAGLMDAQSDVLSNSGREVLERYIRHLFANSPIMCKHLDKDDQLYSGGFVKLAKQVCPKK